MATIKTKGPIFVHVCSGKNGLMFRKDTKECSDHLDHEVVGLDKITNDSTTSEALCNICGRIVIDISNNDSEHFFSEDKVILAHVHRVVDRELGIHPVETFLHVHSECPNSPDGNHELTDIPDDWWSDNRIFRPRGSEGKMIYGAHCIHCGKTAKTHWDLFYEKNIGDKPIPVRGRSEEEVRKMVKTCIYSGMDFEPLDTECIIPGRSHAIVNEPKDWRQTRNIDGAFCSICKRPAVLEK